MKRLLLIVLLSCIIISIGNIEILAKVKFGNWDRWDEQLPSAENQSWYWAVPGLNEPRELRIGADVVGLLFSDIYFYGDKKGETKVSVFFYSPGEVNKKDWDIPNGHFALAGFPPEKGKMIIRAYKMEDQVFRLLEEWEIPFKNHEVVVLEDAKFRREFEEWLKQISPILKTESLLPELVIIQKNNFIITVFADMIINVFKK